MDQLCPQSIDAIAEVVTGSSFTGDGPGVENYRSGPKLEWFFASLNVELAIGNSSRVPTVIDKLEELNWLKLRDELLNGELFLSLADARYIIDKWHLDYNHRRPHSSLNWQTPADYAAGLKHADGVFPSAQPASTPPILS